MMVLPKDSRSSTRSSTHGPPLTGPMLSALNQEPTRLTPLELKAMQLLMVTPGRTVTAEKMLLHLWGRATARERRTLKQLVYRLRQKIERDASSPEILQTTPGAGYKLVAE